MRSTDWRARVGCGAVRTAKRQVAHGLGLLKRGHSLLVLERAGHQSRTGGGFGIHVVRHVAGGWGEHVVHRHVRVVLIRLGHLALSRHAEAREAQRAKAGVPQHGGPGQTSHGARLATAVEWAKRGGQALVLYAAGARLGQHRRIPVRQLACITWSGCLCARLHGKVRWRGEVAWRLRRIVLHVRYVVCRDRHRRRGRTLGLDAHDGGAKRVHRNNGYRQMVVVGE